MNQIFPALKAYLFFTLLLGLAYPLTMTGVSRALFPRQSGGSLIEKDGQIIGSSLIAQKFESPRYFWPRPSSQDYNPQPSGASNLGPISSTLKTQVEDRAKKISEAHNAGTEVPQELLFASGSGLDPHITPEAAYYQSLRVAQARGNDSRQVQRLIESRIRKREFGFLGEPTVNVLELNVALDRELSGVK